MTRQQYVRTAAAVAALGGAAWVTKVGVLATTDGEDTAFVSMLYLAGALGMTLGASWVGVRLAGGRPVPVVIALGVLTALAWFPLYDSVLDPLAAGAIGDAGPAWLGDEAGILLTGLLLSAASLPAWLATPPSPRSARSTT